MFKWQGDNVDTVQIENDNTTMENSFRSYEIKKAHYNNINFHSICVTQLFSAQRRPTLASEVL